MDILVAAHSGVRWLVLLAMLGAIFMAFRHLKDDTWTEGSIKPFSLAAIIFDIQVALGIITYLAGQAWSDNTFIAVIHPLFMLVAVGVWHMAIARARKEASGSSYRVLLIGAIVSLALVIAAIPWAS